MSTCTGLPSYLLQHSKLLSSSSDSTFRTFGFDGYIVASSTFCAFSEALTYFPLFVETSFFGDFWNLNSVDRSFRCKIFLFLVRTVCSVPPTEVFDCFFYFRSNEFFWLLSKNVYRYWKFPLTSFIGILSGNLWDEQLECFLFLAITMWSITSPFSFRAT